MAQRFRNCWGYANAKSDSWYVNSLNSQNDFIYLQNVMK